MNCTKCNNPTTTLQLFTSVVENYCAHCEASAPATYDPSKVVLKVNGFEIKGCEFYNADTFTFKTERPTLNGAQELHCADWDGYRKCKISDAYKARKIVVGGRVVKNRDGKIDDKGDIRVVDYQTPLVTDMESLAFQERMDWFAEQWKKQIAEGLMDPKHMTFDKITGDE